MCAHEARKGGVGAVRGWKDHLPPCSVKHLAVFIYKLTGGGAQRRTFTLANAFADYGHEVDLVVVRGGGLLEAELHPRIRVVALDAPDSAFGGLIRRFRTRGLETAASIPALARYLRRQQPDLLFSAALHVNLVAVAAWRLARLPIALVLRASNHPTGNLGGHPPLQRLLRLWLRWLGRRFYPRADAIVAVSRGVQRELAQLIGISEERIPLIYNPIWTPELLAKMEGPLAHPWFSEGAPPVILAAGTFKIQKDFFTLLEAFARLRRIRKLRLLLLGDGPLRPLLERRVRELGIAADVALPGFVDNVLPWMRRASAFVLSSRWEGLPGVLLEAMACGCPVVSTDCPSGPREILDGGRFGPLVPVGDADALAEAIGRVLDAPPPAELLRARAAEFDLAAAIPRYLELFERCIARHGRARLARIPPWPVRVPLSFTTEAGLDYALGRLCLARADLFAPLAGNAEHRRLMGAMMARLGLPVDLVVAQAWSELVAADLLCYGCRTRRRCRRWLARPEGVPDFCPNRERFLHLRSRLSCDPSGAAPQPC